MAIDYIGDKKKELEAVHDKGVVFTYHFFESTVEHKQKTAEDIVRRLLKLLASDVRPLPMELQEFYDNHQGPRPPKYECLVKCFCLCANELSAFVFIDAFDECTKDQRKEVSKLIKRLVDCGVRVFLTSQPQFTHAIDEIGNHATYRIEAKTDDLVAYISQELKPKWPQLSKEKYESLESELIKKADGM